MPCNGKVYKAEYTKLTDAVKDANDKEDTLGIQIPVGTAANYGTIVDKAYTACDFFIKETGAETFKAPTLANIAVAVGTKTENVNKSESVSIVNKSTSKTLITAEVTFSNIKGLKFDDAADFTHDDAVSTDASLYMAINSTGKGGTEAKTPVTITGSDTNAVASASTSYVLAGADETNAATVRSDKKNESTGGYNYYKLEDPLIAYNDVSFYLEAAANGADGAKDNWDEYIKEFDAKGTNRPSATVVFKYKTLTDTEAGYYTIEAGGRVTAANIPVNPTLTAKDANNLKFNVGTGSEDLAIADYSLGSGSGVAITVNDIKVSIGDVEVESKNYTVASSLVTLKADYLKTLTANTTFKVTAGTLTPVNVTVTIEGYVAPQAPTITAGTELTYTAAATAETNTLQIGTYSLGTGTSAATGITVSVKDGAALTATTDYTTADGKVTLTTDYLDSLTTDGKVTLTIATTGASANATAEVEITVSGNVVTAYAVHLADSFNATFIALGTFKADNTSDTPGFENAQVSSVTNLKVNGLDVPTYTFQYNYLSISDATLTTVFNSSFPDSYTFTFTYKGINYTVSLS